MKFMTKGSLVLLTLLAVGGFKAEGVNAEELNKPTHIEAIVELTGNEPAKQEKVDLLILPKKLTDTELKALENIEKVKELKIKAMDGSTIQAIAEKYHISEDSIEYNNNLLEENPITEGQLLIIGGTEYENAVPDSFYNEKRVIAEAKEAAIKLAERQEAERIAQIAEQQRQETERVEKARVEQQRYDTEQANQKIADEKAAQERANKQAQSQPAKQQAQPAQQQAQPAQQNTNGRQVTVEATAYSRNQPSLSNFTANGTDLRNNPNVIAVNPAQIPLGSQVYIPGYGTYTAADTGGDIHTGRIDIHMESLSSAQAFGRRSITVTVLN